MVCDRGHTRSSAVNFSRLNNPMGSFACPKICCDTNLIIVLIFFFFLAFRGEVSKPRERPRFPAETPTAWALRTNCDPRQGREDPLRPAEDAGRGALTPHVGLVSL